MGAPKELARRFVFAGKEQDIHTGLIDFGARSYDARQGQWLSADPILADYMQGRPVVGVYRPTNLALYSYAWNNPVSVEDPDGRCPECTFAALRETPEESAAVNEAGKNVAAGMWNSLVRKASTAMFVALLGRPVYAPLPTQEEINNAYNQAKAVENAGVIDDVPIEAEIAGEILADIAIGAVVKGAKGPPPLRQQYVNAVEALAQKVPEMRKAGMTSEQIARALHAERRALGEQFKDLTAPEKLAQIHQRNIDTYGDPLGPSIEWLRDAGKSWDDIIESASRPGGRDLGF